MTSELPLGREVSYPETYAPDVLAPIERRAAREATGLPVPLPFTGEDVWTAWELTWLSPSGRPNVAAAQISVPALSPNIVESKSMKLYLGSFAMSAFESLAAVESVIARDLSAAAGADVSVRLITDTRQAEFRPGVLPGTCLDSLDVDCRFDEPSREMLACDADVDAREELHTHLFRSLCPVTGQPDTASVLVSYAGPKLDREALLRYLVSFRRHQDFHEACVERIFVDIKTRCKPRKLGVYARFLRRGGIDINPWRSDGRERMPYVRLWRQ